jgi:hypothetical protein
MSSTAWLLSAGFGFLMIIGVPFAFAIGIVVALSLWVADIDFLLLSQTVVAGTQSFSLLAIPFFMLAGELMSAGGLSQRLIKVADVFVRHLTGGLGHVTVVAATVFSAISGSAPATTAAIGAIMIPAMAARGYSKGFATALAVSAGVLAPLIPPSIAFVIWGVIAEQSIARLFSAGIIARTGLEFDQNHRDCDGHHCFLNWFWRVGRTRAALSKTGCLADSEHPRKMGDAVYLEYCLLLARRGDGRDCDYGRAWSLVDCDRQ